MLRSSCGKTLLVSLEFPTPSSQIISFSLIARVFRRYCCDIGIKNRYSTPAYPQRNGQAEAVNKVIVNGLKKKLDDAKGKWVEELPHVL